MNHNNNRLLTSFATARRFAIIFASFVLGIALLTWLTQTYGVSLKKLERSLSSIGLVLGFVAFVSVLGQSWLSAIKWRLLQGALDSRAKETSTSELTLFSALGVLAAQLLPASLAIVAVRSLVTKFRLKGTFSQGFAITVYDQIFDISVLTVAFLMCGTAFLSGMSAQHAVSALTLLLIISSLGAKPLFSHLQPLRILASLLPDILPMFRKVKSALADAHAAGFDSPEVAAKLVQISIVRYVIIALRSVVAIALAIPALSIWDAVWGYSLVQGTALLPLTPGNVGIVEWAYALVENALKIGGGQIVIAILSLRLVTLLSSLLVVIVCFFQVSFQPSKFRF